MLRQHESDRSTCAQSVHREGRGGGAERECQVRRSEVRDAAQGLLYEGDIHLRTTEIHQ